jgi:outer membrane receptor for ferrienterochelin and colicin
MPGIRTPPFKSNLSISNRNVAKNLGFMINWRWTDAIDNWSNVPSIDNNLPAYSIIDAQMSYRLPKIATSIKAGASNLLNYYHQDYAQGISVGGIYYVSLLYDGIFK